ncbi:hypothetical protein [Desulfotomaculum sp. 1211_IL3151]|uniref:hypothetical protein n=1 Tax=Desulfotomaculum sp. 1211_IL3151 TaxID=3084055 RepID=UPI002FD8FC0D
MGNPNLKEAAKIAEKQVTKAARESAEKVRERNEKGMVPLLHADSASFWAWWGRTSPPNNHIKEVLPPGPPTMKGGSKNRNKKSPKGNKAYVDPWKAI